MPVVLSPDLAIIYIQYAKKALPQPYSDFERFEIFSTLLEELNPLEPYEVHHARIELDARSEVIESLAVRKELYRQWAQSAQTARRPDNKEWNSYIAFVNAQLKFHVNLNYEQFCFLCDAMAGFRLNSLPESKKRSIFWGCVLRREWRFARIKLIIDSRERLEDFIGAVQTNVCGTDLYVARVGAGLELPVVPASTEHQDLRYLRGYECEPENEADNKESVGATKPDTPDTDNVDYDSAEESEEEYENIFAQAKDVMKLIVALQRLERSATGRTEEDVSDNISQLSATITENSEEMKQFGYLLQKRLETFSGSDDAAPSLIHAALIRLALTAQGRENRASEDREQGDSVLEEGGDDTDLKDISLERTDHTMNSADDEGTSNLQPAIAPTTNDMSPAAEKSELDSCETQPVMSSEPKVVSAKSAEHEHNDDESGLIGLGAVVKYVPPIIESGNFMAAPQPAEECRKSPDYDNISVKSAESDHNHESTDSEAGKNETPEPQSYIFLPLVQAAPVNCEQEKMPATKSTEHSPSKIMTVNHYDSSDEHIDLDSGDTNQSSVHEARQFAQSMGLNTSEPENVNTSGNMSVIPIYCGPALDGPLGLVFVEETEPVRRTPSCSSLSSGIIDNRS